MGTSNGCVCARKWSWHIEVNITECAGRDWSKPRIASPRFEHGVSWVQISQCCCEQHSGTGQEDIRTGELTERQTDRQTDRHSHGDRQLQVWRVELSCRRCAVRNSAGHTADRTAVIRGIGQCVRQNGGIQTSNYSTTASTHILPDPLFAFYLTTRRYTELLTASLNKE